MFWQCNLRIQLEEKNWQNSELLKHEKRTLAVNYPKLLLNENSKAHKKMTWKAQIYEVFTINNLHNQPQLLWDRWHSDLQSNIIREHANIKGC